MSHVIEHPLSIETFKVERISEERAFAFTTVSHGVNKLVLKAGHYRST
jgi:hypothetical protein